MKTSFKTFVVIAALLLSFPLQARQKNKGKDPEVRNVILMIGDGMGIGHVTSLMIDNGYEPINMERATYSGLVKTYSYNNRVTDSAASGTTYATGNKTYNARISVDTLGNPLETIIEKAEKRGMSTGIVVTTALMHATPAVFYSHDINRDNYENIAAYLPESGIDVAIGTGRSFLEDREDALDLIAELRSKGYTVTEDLDGLDGIHQGNAMAIYPGEFSGLPFILDGRDPRYLPKATAKALEILTANSHNGTVGRDGRRAGDNGFFMMVEGSQIDGAAHANDGRRLLPELRDFDDAVGVAFDYADTHPGTLVVVLADHETGGLSVIPGNVDFTKAESGVSLDFATKGHSGSLIPLFAYGAGAENFTGVLNNDEVGRRLQQVLGLQ